MFQTKILTYFSSVLFHCPWFCELAWGHSTDQTASILLQTSFEERILFFLEISPMYSWKLPSVWRLAWLLPRWKFPRVLSMKSFLESQRPLKHKKLLKYRYDINDLNTPNNDHVSSCILLNTCLFHWDGTLCVVCESPYRVRIRSPLKD